MFYLNLINKNQLFNKKKTTEIKATEHKKQTNKQNIGGSGITTAVFKTTILQQLMESR